MQNLLQTMQRETMQEMRTDHMQLVPQKVEETLQANVVPLLQGHMGQTRLLHSSAGRRLRGTVHHHLLR